MTITPMQFKVRSTLFLDKCRARTRERRFRRNEGVAKQVQDLVIDEWMPAVADGADTPDAMRRVLARRVRERLLARTAIPAAVGDRKAGILWFTLAMWILPIIIKWLIKRWWDRQSFNYKLPEPIEEKIVAIVQSEEFWGGKIGKAIKSFAISAVAALLVVLAQWLEALPTEWAADGKWWALPAATLIPWCVNMVKLFGTKIKDWGAPLSILTAFGAIAATWPWR